MSKPNITHNLVEKSARADVDFSSITFGHVYSDHMFVTDYNGTEWVDHRIEPYGPLGVCPGVAALHYAQAVFEGMKAYRSDDDRILMFRPDQNFERLNKSAHRMKIPEVPEDLFFEALDQLIKIDRDWVPDLPDMSLYIRPFIFASDQYIGIRPSETYKFIIFLNPVGGYYNKPLKVRVEQEYSRAAPGGTGASKAAGNYASSLYPMHNAQLDGYDQLIWTDACKHEEIEESGTMNLMFYIENKLITPALNDRILPGIIRQSVIDLAKEWGVPVEERVITVNELMDHIKAGNVQEAFGLGTAAVVAPIEVIGHEGVDHQLPTADTHEFSKRAYNTLNDIRYGRVPDERGWTYEVK